MAVPARTPGGRLMGQGRWSSKNTSSCLANDTVSRYGWPTTPVGESETRTTPRRCSSTHGLRLLTLCGVCGLLGHGGWEHRFWGPRVKSMATRNAIVSAAMTHWLASVVEGKPDGPGRGDMRSYRAAGRCPNGRTFENWEAWLLARTKQIDKARRYIEQWDADLRAKQLIKDLGTLCQR